MAGTKEKDAVTGVETTGHEWDGIRELNNPLPRWWQWVLWATVIWAVGYWIAMPAWPLISGYTGGMLGYSQRQVVADSIAEARQAQSGYLERIREAELVQIRNDPELLEFAMAGGRSAYQVNCSQCHGQGAAGARGYPNLNDDDWLWGGTLEDIHATLKFGIRSGHEEARDNRMPAFGTDGLLDRGQIRDLAEYVLSLSGRSEESAAVERGAALFAEQCAACHGEDGGGNRELGAPNLRDPIWLYGGERDDIIASISRSRAGVMPAWSGRLDEETLKQLAVYIHVLGGGE